MTSMIGKKGSAFDILFIIGIIFAVALSGLLGLTVLTKFNANLANVTSVNTTIGVEMIDTVESTYNVIDNSMPLLLIGANLVILFMSFAVKDHPIMFVFILLLLVVMIIAAAVLADSYYAIATNPLMSEAASTMDITQFIMNNIVMIQVIFGFVDMIVMLGISRQG